MKRMFAILIAALFMIAVLAVMAAPAFANANSIRGNSGFMEVDGGKILRPEGQKPGHRGG